jgi:hypothetical protein
MTRVTQLKRRRRPAMSPNVQAVLERAELRSIQDAHDVGKFVLDTFHDGDVREFRSRKRSSPALRELAEDMGDRLSTPTLWRAVSVYLLAVRWPGLLDSRHLRVSHVYSVLDLDPKDQMRLLRKAERLLWTRHELLDEASPLKPKRRSSKPPARTSRRPQKIPRLPRGAARELASLLGSVRKRLNKMPTWLSDAIRSR